MRFFAVLSDDGDVRHVTPLKDRTVFIPRYVYIYMLLTLYTVMNHKPLLYPLGLLWGYTI